MKTYDTYKPSGVDLIAKIPSTWKAIRLKFLLSQNSGGVWGSDYDGVNGIATKVFRSTEINLDGSWNFDEEPELRLLSEQEKKKALLIEGDLLVTKSSGSQLHIGKTALVTKEIEELQCCYSNFMQRLRPAHKESAKYLHIFLNSKVAREQYNFLSNSTTGLANLSAELINEVIVPIPDITEQPMIANYLDEETHQIDKLVALKQQLIELLKEERKSIINQAVTKGINPNAKLKPSGIDWIGDIPELWQVKRLKFVTEKITTGSTPPSNKDEYFEEEVNWFTPSDFSDELCLKESRRKISTLAIEQGIVKLFPANSILIVGIGATLGKVGYIKEVASSNQQINAIYMTSLDKAKFYSYFFHVNQSNVSALANAATLAILNQSQTKDIPTIVPASDNEINEIVKFIEEIELGFSKTISKIEKEIKLLWEYRTALIAEVVTGKIKVV